MWEQTSITAIAAIENLGLSSQMHMEGTTVMVSMTEGQRWNGFVISWIWFGRMICLVLAFMISLKQILKWPVKKGR